MVGQEGLMSAKTILDVIISGQIKHNCEYTYAGTHDLSIRSESLAKIATCKHCRGEWEIRDGRATERKAPVSPWPVDD